MVGAVPILVLDMYEHAYHREFGANTAAYVDVFMRIVDWTVVAERFMGSTGDGRRHEAEPRKETLASISVEELQTIMQSEQHFQVVDARPRKYVSKDPDTMRNAVWRDPERVDEWSAQLSPDAPVFVYCAYGFESGAALPRRSGARLRRALHSRRTVGVVLGPAATVLAVIESDVPVRTTEANGENRDESRQPGGGDESGASTAARRWRGSPTDRTRNERAMESHLKNTS